MNCIAFTSCRPATPPPSKSPVTPPPSTSPTPRPSNEPTAEVVTNSPVTDAPVEVFTMRPTPRAVTDRPTLEQDEEDWTLEASITEEPQQQMPITAEPTGKPTPNPTRHPTDKPSPPPQIALPPSKSGVIPAPSHELIAMVGSILVAAASDISDNILVKIDAITQEKSPTQFYQYGGFINALGVISKGDMGKSYFYLGPNDNLDYGPEIGLANVALFLAQAVIETVQFDVCDDISWEKDVFGLYPLSNSCGQGRFAGLSSVSYEESNPCSASEAFMACEVDADMRAVAETKAIFVGAPPPLECYPTTATEMFTGAWDPSLSCEKDGCSSYEGQTMGNIDLESIPTSNSVSAAIYVLH